MALGRDAVGLELRTEFSVLVDGLLLANLEAFGPGRGEIVFVLSHGDLGLRCLLMSLVGDPWRGIKGTTGSVVAGT